MLSTDSQLRAARLVEVIDILKQKAAPEDRELVLALGPVVLSELPERLALGLPAPALAARLLSHFKFIAREMPPAHQLYRGLPGIHVVARNPGEAESAAMGGGQGLPLATTVVETHTADTPFIFESLKNYFQKAGLRVFSAIHPVFTVRRQWERVVWIGACLRRGQPGVLLPLPDRAGRVEGAAAPHRARGLLGPEGGVPGRRGLPGHGPGVHGAGRPLAQPARERGGARCPRAPS